MNAAIRTIVTIVIVTTKPWYYDTNINNYNDIIDIIIMLRVTIINDNNSPDKCNHDCYRNNNINMHNT